MTKDEYMTKKMKILGMLAKMPDDKLQELEEFLRNLMRKEFNHGNNKKTRQFLSD